MEEFAGMSDKTIQARVVAKPIEHKEGWVFKTARVARDAVRELLTSVVPAVVLAFLINVFVAEAVVVDGPSMQPNLYRGYRLMTEKISYRFHSPRRGDVVIIERPVNEVPLVKRVVALPGELVEVRNGHVYIDDKPLQEPWVENFGGPNYPATRVPLGHVFVLGDNRGNSRDSRAIGPVAIETIKGRAGFIYWPLNRVSVMQ